jgi:hypothetical protein
MRRIILFVRLFLIDIVFISLGLFCLFFEFFFHVFGAVFKCLKDCFSIISGWFFGVAESVNADFCEEFDK